MDLVTVEDWGEEIFPEGGGVKLKKLSNFRNKLKLLYNVWIALSLIWRGGVAEWYRVLDLKFGT